MTLALPGGVEMLKASPEAVSFQSPPIITFGYIIQVFLSLLIVLGLILFIAKYLLPRLKLNPNGKMIKILDRVYLEPQLSAYVLRVGKSAWLIVANSKQIARIDKLDEENLPLE